jgi:hypothetical protein
MSTQTEEIFKIASSAVANLLTVLGTLNAKRPSDDGGPFALMHAAGGD